jgi:outer membrane lipoprotein-sorting protein
MKKLFLLLFFGVFSAFSQTVQSGDELLKAMHKRYDGKWYKTLTFVQKTTQVRADSTTTTSTWYEAFSFPGTMRIDIDTAGTNGMIFTKDSLYSFRNGTLATIRFFVHPLLLLGFDVYFLDPGQASEKLKNLHIDLSIVREDQWQGRPVYVVGANEGDLHSPQFWIDREHLLFVRLLEPGGRGGSQTRETQFNKYERLGGGWISTEVIFKLDGRLQMKEEYSELRANPALDLKLFDPLSWKTVRWR